MRELENAGADATKVGIGPGKVCITKIKTGFGTGGWQLVALRWCAKALQNQLLLMVAFVHMEISLNLYVLVLQW